MNKLLKTDWPDFQKFKKKKILPRELSKVVVFEIKDSCIENIVKEIALFVLGFFYILGHGFRTLKNYGILAKNLCYFEGHLDSESIIINLKNTFLGHWSSLLNFNFGTFILKIEFKRE